MIDLVRITNTTYNSFCDYCNDNDCDDDDDKSSIISKLILKCKNFISKKKKLQIRDFKYVQRI